VTRDDYERGAVAVILAMLAVVGLISAAIIKIMEAPK
jgi:hypothetical protein